MRIPKSAFVIFFYLLAFGGTYYFIRKKWTRIRRDMKNDTTDSLKSKVTDIITNILDGQEQPVIPGITKKTGSFDDIDSTFASVEARKEEKRKEEARRIENLRLEVVQNAIRLEAHRIESKRVSSVEECRKEEAKRIESPVKCTIFAPPFILPGKSLMVQVFAHLNGQDGLVKKLSKDFDNKAKIRATKELDNEISRGTELVFNLSMKGVNIDDSIQKLIWRGKPEAVQFGVTIPGDHEPGDIIGTVYVMQDTIPFGHIKFKLTVEMIESIPMQGIGNREGWKRYNYAFISYASPDRSEVLKRVQMLPRAGINFFQDLLTLEPGERWEKGLYENIDKSDVFFLFWSSAAKNSKWVMQEVNYALAKKGTPEIVPILIEGPPPVLPPPELSDLHFNDTFLYFINPRE